ncbi:glycosyltransferase family 4 protein [Massilia sp. R2A-15]|uniref:glycosyltransferase family 4 protein n=1 Tax=Massilia sp. R2A-15 TaxID=3064278 RepID=UPI002735D217|nr:glycosyltransferase family 4 protein [Massilia sp. R2A-15]WLI88017.1 glycosyltransferase family 4 protein [Massilia sp. R2A-15]
MKPIVLTLTSCYLPGFRGGGPIQTIRNMVEHLGDEFDFRIITTDRDLGDHVPYADIRANAWNAVGKAQVYYVSNSLRALPVLLKLILATPYDVLYLNSFFDPRFTLLPMVLRWLDLVAKKAVVLAPRGEFTDGALRIKRWKKTPFIRLARRIGLFSTANWHASTTLEAADIQKVFPNVKNVHVANNVIIAPDLLQKLSETFPLKGEERGVAEPINICFLSRISPMKNLEFALEVLRDVSVPVAFNIYGPKEDAGYWSKCEARIKLLPPNISVAYCGPVPHSGVRKAISAHDIFFVPSRGENFGHVFMEALSAGVPILVSDRTPWRDLQSRRVGWDLSLDDRAAFATAIEKFALSNAAEKREIRMNCLRFAKEKVDDPHAVELSRTLFRRALAMNS